MRNNVPFFKRRMNRELQIAVDWMTAPRSDLLDLFKEMVVQVAAVTTAVRHTPTLLSSVNLRQVRVLTPV